MDIPPIWSFGEFELDEGLCELRRSGRPVELRRRPLELLCYLVRRRHRVVSKAELYEHVWKGVAVSETALSSAVRDLRRALGDNGASQHAIKTCHGVGYRFAAPVVEAQYLPEGPVVELLRARVAGGECLCDRLLAFLAGELAAPGALDALSSRSRADRDTADPFRSLVAQPTHSPASSPLRAGQG